LVRGAEPFLSTRTAFPSGEAHPAGAPPERAQGAPAGHRQAACGTSLGLGTPSPERHLEADAGATRLVPAATASSHPPAPSCLLI